MKIAKLIIAFSLLFNSFCAMAKTHRPFVFLHGLGVPTEIYQIPFSLEKMFQKMGHPLIVIKSPAVATQAQVKEIFAKDLATKLPKGTFHLIAHSQGGVVARLLALDPRFSSRILSVTTLDSPHHGSILADDIVALWKEGKGILPDWAKEILDKYFGGNINSLYELTVENMEGKFNTTVLNNPTIRYFSMGHYIPFPEWKFTFLDILARTSIYMKLRSAFPNDGLVPLKSTQWGESLGEYPGDHWAETFPIPFGGKIIVDDTFKRVVDNIDKNFND